MNTLTTLRVSDAVRRLNPDHFPPVHVPGLVDAPVRQAVRQKRGDGMNKAERMALEWLRARYPSAACIREGITLRLANGVRYTPDFAVCSHRTTTLYEVKAMRGNRVHVEDDSAVKLKVAAREWPNFAFVLIWLDERQGAHVTQEILP